MTDPSIPEGGAAKASGADNAAAPVSNGYRRYVLVLLTLVYALNFIDRQILVILQESIKVDMDLSDSQLGLLTGFAFAIFYVSVGIPIARWADLGNRRNIVSLAVAVWSGMTALSGFTQNFWQLLMARIGVGVGEAGGSPPSHSMISDYYPVEQRGSALSFYSTGVYLGILLGFLIGGWINSEFGWRTAFFVVGVPGFLVALLVRFTIREPVRGGLEGRALETPATFGETLRTLKGFGSFKLFAIAAGLNAFSSYGIGNFTPSFLIRSHGFSSLEVGTSLALITGIGGALGTYMGGVLADRFGANDKRWYLWVSGIPAACSVPLMFTAVFIGDPRLALGFLFFATMLGAFYLGPTIAISHTLVSPSMRAMASAILFFILNLIGLGLGPLVVGMLSDLLAPTYGSESLRYALGIVSFVNLISAAFFFLAARKLLADLKK
ncbi:major facilitator family transporter [marine gamma proteobacterium HTCC2207]|jgi:MFS family permease|uniref:Major facilitator family transporter n=1 Tax=gamma proteobacterium HTCC2207 TaxID=314287 RepID=Q1YU91_9GAMM|nr:major facilitator family transporter [marine gamma proteobacterium HTCC2207] [gamma proteobacterium HTCC2207]MBT5106283.1 MFS transporter [Porticoccaceae bacterium]MBT6115616.1 MFS transporter [Porticoccaceae bacterium]MBT6593592.1 MFS transporter [Porticoccaceae bacterium]